MTLLGPIHTVAALVAVASGAAVLLQPKGTRRHRQLGWTYVVSMVALNVTALSIYRLTGRFGAFHVAALVSVATLAAGLLPAVRRRPPDGWVESHYRSEEHTSELQSRQSLVCRLLLEKQKKLHLPLYETY